MQWFLKIGQIAIMGFFIISNSINHWTGSASNPVGNPLVAVVFGLFFSLLFTVMVMKLLDLRRWLFRLFFKQLNH